MILKHLFLPLLLSISYQASFAHSFNPEKIADGFKFAEGIIIEDSSLIVSDISASKIYSIKNKNLETLASDTNKATGIIRDLDGSILACEQNARLISRYDKDFNRHIVVDSYNGSKLNSPNDLTMKSDGTVFFTDPAFGKKKDNLLPFAGVFKLAPDRKTLSLLDNSLAKPNGIAISPNKNKLYVGDSSKSQIIVFSLDENDKVLSKEIFATNLKNPDGIKVDKNENVYCATKEGVLIFNEKGELLHTINLGTNTVNCQLDNSNQKLYIATRQNLFLVDLP